MDIKVTLSNEDVEVIETILASNNRRLKLDASNPEEWVNKLVSSNLTPLRARLIARKKALAIEAINKLDPSERAKLNSVAGISEILTNLGVK